MQYLLCLNLIKIQFKSINTANMCQQNLTTVWHTKKRHFSSSNIFISHSYNEKTNNRSQTKFKNYAGRFLNVSTNFQYKKKQSIFVYLSCKATDYKYDLSLALCRTILIAHTNLPKFNCLIGIFFTCHAFFYYYFVWLSYNIHNNYQDKYITK